MGADTGWENQDPQQLTFKSTWFADQLRKTSKRHQATRSRNMEGLCCCHLLQLLCGLTDL